MGITVNPKKESGGGGSVTGAESGTYVNTGKVRLSSAGAPSPLLENVAIPLGGFNFEIDGSHSQLALSNTQFFAQGTSGTVQNSIDVDGSSAELVCLDTGTSDETEINVTPTQITLSSLGAGIANIAATITRNLYQILAADAPGNSSNSFFRANQVGFEVGDTNGSGGTVTVSALGAGPPEVDIFYQDALTGKLIEISFDAVNGIIVNDTILNIGMRKNPAILPATQLADPTAYVTTDCLSAFGVGIVASVNNNSQTVSNAGFLTYAVPADGTFRINLSLGVNTSGGGSVAGTFTYTDIAGNVQSAISMGTAVSGANPDGDYAPRVIRAKSGTNIVVATTVIGVIDYNASAIIEKLL